MVIYSLKIWNSQNIWFYVVIYHFISYEVKVNQSEPQKNFSKVLDKNDKSSVKTVFIMWTRIDWSVSHFSITIVKSSFDVENWEKRLFLRFKTAYQSSLTMSRKLPCEGSWIYLTLIFHEFLWWIISMTATATAQCRNLFLIGKYQYFLIRKCFPMEK